MCVSAIPTYRVYGLYDMHSTSKGTHIQLLHMHYVACKFQKGNFLDIPTLTTQILVSCTAGDSGPQNSCPIATPVEVEQWKRCVVSLCAK